MMNVAGERDVCVPGLLERLGELANPADVGSFLVDADFEGWSGAGHAWANRRCCASGLSTDGLSRAGSVSAILVNGTL